MFRRLLGYSVGTTVSSCMVSYTFSRPHVINVSDNVKDPLSKTSITYTKSNSMIVLDELCKLDCHKHEKSVELCKRSENPLKLLESTLRWDELRFLGTRQYVDLVKTLEKDGSEYINIKDTFEDVRDFGSSKTRTQIEDFIVSFNSHKIDYMILLDEFFKQGSMDEETFHKTLKQTYLTPNIGLTFIPLVLDQDKLARQLTGKRKTCSKENTPFDRCYRYMRECEDARKVLDKMVKMWKTDPYDPPRGRQATFWQDYTSYDCRNIIFLGEKKHLYALKVLKLDLLSYDMEWYYKEEASFLSRREISDETKRTIQLCNAVIDNVDTYVKIYYDTVRKIMDDEESKTNFRKKIREKIREKIRKKDA